MPHYLMWLILDYVSSFQHFGLKSFAPAKHTGEKFKIKNCLFISIVARWKFSFCRAGAGGDANLKILSEDEREVSIT